MLFPSKHFSEKKSRFLDAWQGLAVIRPFPVLPLNPSCIKGFPPSWWKNSPGRASDLATDTKVTSQPEGSRAPSLVLLSGSGPESVALWGFGLVSDLDPVGSVLLAREPSLVTSIHDLTVTCPLFSRPCAPRSCIAHRALTVKAERCLL